MPEQIERPDGVRVNAITLYRSLAFGQVREGTFRDGAGNKFLGSMFQKGNCTIVYIRKLAPDGVVLGKWNVVFEDAPDLSTPPTDPAWSGVGKIDDFAMCQDDRALEVVLGGHDTDAVRQNPVAVARIEGVCEPHVHEALPPPPPPPPVPTPEPPTPCVLPGNRDYFKPNNPFTRAQAMKVIAIMAAGSADAVPDTTTQTFEDVPVGSTFHKFIEYVFGEGAINGYDCTPEG